MVFRSMGQKNNSINRYKKMINNRRNFIKTTAIASVALALNSFKGKSEKEALFLSKKGKKPIVLSTWNFGIQANEAAWEILKNNGRALDAVEAGSKDS